MIADARDVRWIAAAPANSLPLHSLMLSHPAIGLRLQKIFGAQIAIRRRSDGHLSFDLGGRGFEITQAGVEPWQATEVEEDGEWRTWLAIQKPWQASSTLGTEIWSYALLEFEDLLHSGRLELVGRFDSLRSPACYVPPSGIDRGIWTTPKVSFEKGVIVLNSGEIVYDVHILPTAMSEAPQAAAEAWNVDRLTEWIRAQVRASPLKPTMTRAGLMLRKGTIKLRKDQIHWCWNVVMESEEKAAAAAWRKGGHRSQQSYPGID